MEKLNDETTKYNKARQLTLNYINYQMHLQKVLLLILMKLMQH